MWSTTSCFNSTLYRKTMLRFWPFWVLYGLFWLFALPLNLITQYFQNIRRGTETGEAQRWLLDLAQHIPDFLTFGVGLSLVCGVLCAMAVFGYLYNNRSCCMIHALPMRRETLFTTQYLAGLSFLLLPHLAVGILTLVTELILMPPAHWSMALPSLGIWILVQSGTALFFFSFAAFCAMFTGHTLALPAFYGILNGLVYVIYYLISELLAQFFYGFPGGHVDGPLVEYCTPVYALVDACRWEDSLPTETFEGTSILTSGVAYLRSPATVAAYAAVGLVFALLALMIYRHRHVESAGDVVSIHLVRPIFKYGVSFCSGLCFGVFTTAFFGWYGQALTLSLCVLFWAAVGYFAAEMLLKKSFRVFKAWKGCVAMMAALTLLCATCFLDLFGVVSRVPGPGQVASLSLTANMGYPYDSGNINLENVTDKELISQIINLHRAIIADKDRSGSPRSTYASLDNYISFDVSYYLADGSTLSRQYFSVPIFLDELDQEGTVTWQANQLIQNRNSLALSYNFDAYEAGRLVEAYLAGVYNQKIDSLDTLYLEGYAQELWQAVRQDFSLGNLGMRYLFDNDERLNNTYRTDLCFTWEMASTERGSRPGDTLTTTVTVTLTPQASHTLAILEKVGALGDTYVLQPHSGATSNVIQAKPTIIN